jgi:hypothetical protein
MSSPHTMSNAMGTRIIGGPPVLDSGVWGSTLSWVGEPLTGKPAFLQALTAFSWSDFLRNMSSCKELHLPKLTSPPTHRTPLLVTLKPFWASAGVVTAKVIVNTIAGTHVLVTIRTFYGDLWSGDTLGVMADDALFDEIQDNTKEAGQRLGASLNLLRSQGKLEDNDYRELATRLSTVLAMTEAAYLEARRRRES